MDGAPPSALPLTGALAFGCSSSAVAIGADGPGVVSPASPLLASIAVACALSLLPGDDRRRWLGTGVPTGLARADDADEPPPPPPGGGGGAGRIGRIDVPPAPLLAIEATEGDGDSPTVSSASSPRGALAGRSGVATAVPRPPPSPDCAISVDRSGWSAASTIGEPIPGAPDLFPTAAAVVSPFSEVILTVSALNRESGVNINTGWAYRWNKRDARCGLNACGNYTRWTRRERQGFAGQVAQRVAILTWYKKQTFVAVGRAMEECSALSMDI